MRIHEVTPVVHTVNDVRYLKSPGVALISEPSFNPEPLRPFLRNFDVEYEEYVDESLSVLSEGSLSNGAMLAKWSGQICYLSVGEKRTRHDKADVYFDNILKQGHGSILEHANYTVLVYGVDRAVTHEWVRHRHAAYSQVSQRFVGLNELRFVMPYADLGDPELEARSLTDFQYDRERYAWRIEKYLAKFPQREGESKTDARKRVQSEARRVLPNWVEAPIVITHNVRAWRHTLTMRCSPYADVAIRRAGMPCLDVLRGAVPELFADFEEKILPDGTRSAAPKYLKV